MRTINSKYIGRNIIVIYNLQSWALPLEVSFQDKIVFNCKALYIDILCFGIRIFLWKGGAK